MLLTIIVMPVIGVFAALIGRRKESAEAVRERAIDTLLNSQVIQERVKDPNFNLADFVDKIYPKPTSSGMPMGIIEKMSRDITWDVSGIIGLIVTVVLMFMVVSRTVGDMPKEIIAGWTTILGFYFGKATTTTTTTRQAG